MHHLNLDLYAALRKRRILEQLVLLRIPDKVVTQSSISSGSAYYVNCLSLVKRECK